MKLLTLIPTFLFAPLFSFYGQLPKASLTVLVIDEVSNPISGAKVEIDNDVDRKPPSGDGITIPSGKHTAILATTGSLYYGASKEGYYSCIGEFYFNQGAMKGDPSLWPTRRWEPWNPTVEVVLKSKGKVVPMYAKEISLITLPVPRGPVGYDFQKGDWIGSSGKGESSDLIFTSKGDSAHYSYVLNWTFSNKGDGIIRVQPKGKTLSGLRSPKEAPLEGYQSEITLDEEGKVPGTSTEEWRPDCFIFRVRTVLDNRGKVVSANYGKIYTAGGKATYYFNPEINSRNLEFDIKRNLFTGQASYDRINEP